MPPEPDPLDDYFQAMNDTVPAQGRGGQFPAPSPLVPPAAQSLYQPPLPQGHGGAYPLQPPPAYAQPWQGHSYPYPQQPQGMGRRTFLKIGAGVVVGAALAACGLGSLIVTKNYDGAQKTFYGGVSSISYNDKGTRSVGDDTYSILLDTFDGGGAIIFFDQRLDRPWKPNGEDSVPFYTPFNGKKEKIRVRCVSEGGKWYVTDVLSIGD